MVHQPPSNEDWRKAQNDNGSKPSPEDETVRVLVGHGQSTGMFFFHRHRLTTHSLFCDTALGFRWQEGKEGTIRLPEDDPTLFGIFCSFVHQGEVHSANSNAEVYNEDGELVDDLEFDRLIALWFLGDELISPTPQDAVLDRLTVKLNDELLYPEDLPQRIYPATVGPCGLRRLVVDIALWLWPKGEMANIPMDESWNEFFKDCAIRAGSEEGSKREKFFFVAPGCRYHNHRKEKGNEGDDEEDSQDEEEEEECYREMW